jgi:GGDEF domain-containing protein
VLLRGHDLPAALQVAERLRRAVEVWRWDAPDLGIRGESLTITIGAAALGSGSADADDLRRAADDAFHRAEAAGWNRVSG